MFRTLLHLASDRVKRCETNLTAIIGEIKNLNIYNLIFLEIEKIFITILISKVQHNTTVDNFNRL